MLRILAFLVIFTACDLSDPFSDDKSDSKGVPGTSSFSLVAELNSELDHYQDCQAIADDLDKRIGYMNEYWRHYTDYDRSERIVESASAGDQSQGVESKEANITNTQEVDVDEDDFVKRNDFHLLVLRGTRLDVISRSDLNLIGSIDLDFVEQPIWDKITHLQMYAYQNRVTIVGPAPVSRKGDYFIAKTRIITLESSSGEMPKEVTRHDIDSTLVRTRLAGNRLLVISHAAIHYNPMTITIQDQSVPIPRMLERIPDQITEGKFLGVACDKVIKPMGENDFLRSAVRVASYDLSAASLAEGEKALILPGVTAQNIYVGSSNILLYGFNSWTPYLQQDWWADWTTPVTEIYYNRETGDLKAQGRVGLPGTIASQEWSFKQLSDSSVAIATTTRNPLTSVESFKVSENLEVGRNHLWVLRSENQVLKSLGSIINFGKPREDVRAVRYIDDMAYIVTFERTDPLYAINLSNREAPKVEDALEIPGFSMYLHPLSDQWLAGVGYDAEDRGDTSFYQGIQVSLFDISSQKTIQVDRKIFGTRGSYSDVTGNHKAFFFDSERSVFGVPMTLREGDSTDLFTLNPFGFSGMTLFSPSADGLIEKARITHSELVQEYCGDPNNNWRGWQSSMDSLDINRAFVHEGRVVSISRFGLKAHHLDSYEVESITRFSDGARYCSEEIMRPVSGD